MLHMMLVDNLIHADLHPGNILVQLHVPGGKWGARAAEAVQAGLWRLGVSEPPGGGPWGGAMGWEIGDWLDESQVAPRCKGQQRAQRAMWLRAAGLCLLY